MLLCRTDGELQTYSISSRGSGLQSMRIVGSPSLNWPILPPWPPNIGPLEAVPALRPRARGNAGARPKDVALQRERNCVTGSLTGHDDDKMHGPADAW